jgi:hypothetical protein
MKPLYHDPHFTFRFADDRLIPQGVHPQEDQEMQPLSQEDHGLI